MMLVMMCESLDTRGSIDYIADDCSIHTSLGPDCPEYDISCIESDTDIDIATDRRYLEFFDELLYLYGCMYGILRMLLVEYSEHTVAEIFVDIAMMRVDDIPDPIEVDIEQ